MKIGVFGDVHGCVDEMRMIISDLRSAGATKIVSLGDLVDRGPDSAACVELWDKERRTFEESVLILGNHDSKVLRAAGHTRRFFDCGKAIPMNMASLDQWCVVERDGVLVSSLVGNERGERIIKILENSVLFHQHGDYAFVHGGIPTRMRHLPSKIHKCKDFMYCRYVADDDGRMITLGEEGGIPHHFWAEDYDGRFGKVFFGHQPHGADEIFDYKHAVALDTGCVFGGVISGAVIDTETGDIDLYQRSARAQYAENRRP